MNKIDAIKLFFKALNFCLIIDRLDLTKKEQDKLIKLYIKRLLKENDKKRNTKKTP